MEKDFFERYHRFYMIGAGGISMSALSKFLRSIGKTVGGYDTVRSGQTDELEEEWNVKMSIGEEDESVVLQYDVVVYSDAVPQDGVLLTAARREKKIILGRADLLRYICSFFPNVLAVGGSHGKTTCTAMCAHVLKEVHVPFCAHIGGEDGDFGNFYSCGGEYFVTEACEYKKNLLKVRANRAILLNVDRDHMECYDGEDDLIATFAAYCENAQTAFVCADDEKCMRFGRQYTTFGIDNPHCDYRAVLLKPSKERYSFTVYEYGKPLCRVRLQTAGKCNVYNALAAFAAMRSYGFSETEIARGLERFKGVKRRFETVGEVDGAALICDYAHHPREIASTVETAEKLCKNNLYVVFQPHTYSRTRLLMGEFVPLFRKMKNVMIYKTFPAREPYDEAGSGKTLASAIGNCLYAESLKELKAWLKGNVRSGDVLLFLGAGDIYHAARRLLKDWNRL